MITVEKLIIYNRFGKIDELKKLAKISHRQIKTYPVLKE